MVQTQLASSVGVDSRNTPIVAELSGTFCLTHWMAIAMPVPLLWLVWGARCVPHKCLHEQLVKSLNIRFARRSKLMSQTVRSDPSQAAVIRPAVDMSFITQPDPFTCMEPGQNVAWQWPTFNCSIDDVLTDPK
jgi:hypothetical protein